MGLDSRVSCYSNEGGGVAGRSAARKDRRPLFLNDYLVRNKPATFLFTVKGNSKIGASIEEGDKVIVDRALAPKHDDIVIAVVEGDYTLKRLYKHMGRVELRAEMTCLQPHRFQ